MFGLGASVASAAVTCTPTIGALTALRAESRAELLNDITVSCVSNNANDRTLGSTASGEVPRMATLTITSSAPFSPNTIDAATSTSDVLVLAYSAGASTGNSTQTNYPTDAGTANSIAPRKVCVSGTPKVYACTAGTLTAVEAYDGTANTGNNANVFLAQVAGNVATVRFPLFILTNGAATNLKIANLRVVPPAAAQGDLSNVSISVGLALDALVTVSNGVPTVMPAVTLVNPTNATGVAGVSVVSMKGTLNANALTNTVAFCTAISVGTGSAGNNTASILIEETNNMVTGFRTNNNGTLITDGGLGTTNIVGKSSPGSRVAMKITAPAGVGVLMPVAVSTVTNGVTTTAKLLSNPTANGYSTTGVTSNATATTDAVAGYKVVIAPTTASTTVTVFYNIDGVNAGLDAINVLPLFYGSPGTIPNAAGSSVTVAVSPAPLETGATDTTMGRFNSAAIVSGTLVTTNGCSCTLLFPFVTNAGGYDTGFSISNTSATVANDTILNNASTSSGTFTLRFWPADGTAPVAQTSSVPVPAGGTATFIASSGNPAYGLNPGPSGFTGYVTVTSNFQYCHGFAYISAIGAGPTTPGMSTSYTGLVMSSARAGGAVAGAEALGN